MTKHLTSIPIWDGKRAPRKRNGRAAHLFSRHVPVRTAPEVRPVLIGETGRHARPAILVAEDDPRLANLLVQSLELIGRGHVRGAASLDQALDLAGSGPWSLAILDFDLGGVDSRPVADLLAAQGVPMVFVSGDPQHEAVVECYPRSCFLAKPYTLSTLEGVLAAVLP